MKLLLLILPALVALAQPAPPTVLFEDVTVIDAEGVPALAGVSVLVQDGRIRTIGKRVRAPKGAARVNGGGKFLMYGLSDMHVHLRGGQELVEDNAAWLPLFLANGVTTIRDMGGDLGEHVMRWRGEVAAGRREGPRILTAGPKLDGPKPVWPGSIPIATPEEGRAAVRKVKVSGADFVKVYFSFVSSEVHAAILDEARKLKLEVTGHLPNNMSLEEAAGRGQHIEHFHYSLSDGASRAAAEIRASYKGPPSLAELTRNGARAFEAFDTTLLPGLATRLRQNRTWLTTTLLVAGRRQNLPPDRHAGHPLRKYLFPGIWKTWDLDTGRRRAPTPASANAYAERRRTVRSALAALHRDGVSLMAGSDCGASNNFAWPGWSLHEELEEVVASGLAPLDALRLATRAPARFLREERTRGSIAAGRIADLVLLDANPLESIANTRLIAGVMARGRWYDRAALDAKLRAVEDAAARKGSGK